jgi:two-component system, NarL family, response regulator DesR
LEKIKVILVDDHELIRKAVRKILARESGIEVVGETGRGDEVQQYVARLCPDVLVMDIHLPGIEGDEITHQLQQSGSSVRTLIISAEADPDYIGELLNGEVCGYLVKEDIPLFLADAVRKVAAGEKGWFGKHPD